MNSEEKIKVRSAWENFLNPDVMRPRLVAASIFIAGFEILKNSIIDHIRNFYWNGFDENGDIISPDYEMKVLSRNKSKLYASLDWLKESKALNNEDMVAFEKIRKCRNSLAHNLAALLGADGLPPDFDQTFQDMISLLRKIEVWWIMNVEVPTNPDYDGLQIDEAGIVPGPVISLQLLCTIALGTEEESRFYYDKFRKYFKDMAPKA